MGPSASRHTVCWSPRGPAKSRIGGVCWTSSIVRVNSGPARCSNVTRAGGAVVVVWCQTSASTRGPYTASCPRTRPSAMACTEMSHTTPMWVADPWLWR